MKEDTNTMNTSPSTAKTNGKWQSKEGKSNLGSSASNSTDSSEGLQDQVISGAKDAYNSIVSSTSGALGKFGTTTSGFVKDYPMQTAIGALAVGFLLGAAVCSRRGE